MRQFLFVCIFIIPGGILFAQDVEQTDSLETKKRFNVHIVPYAQWNEVFGRQMAYGGGDLEIAYDDRIVLGFFGEVMLGTFLKRIVFPNIYEFSNYKYGLLGGYNFPVGEKLMITGRLKLSKQDVKWTEHEGATFALSDDCFEIRPLLGTRYSPVKWASVGGYIGYNFTQGLELSGMDQKDMNGIVLSLNLGLRF